MAVVCLGLGSSCDDVESTSGASPSERIVTALGGDGHAMLCDDASSCVATAVGDALGAGTLDTPPGETVSFRDEGGFVWALDGSSRLDLASQPRLLRGRVVVSSLGGTSSHGTFSIAGAVARFSNERPVKLAVTTDGVRGQVSVLRGEVTIERGGQSVELRRGQSIDLDAIDGASSEQALIARYGEAPIVVGTPSTSDPEASSKSIGLGRMTARRPGTNQMIDGMKLASHRVDAVVDRGLASTVVEEIFENTTNETLEGTFTFTLPPGALVSDLVLWVGDDPVPAEIVEKGRAKQIFKGIVDDTVRPKDPALLEWKSGQTVSLSIFPIAPKSSRRVRFRFEERLSESDGRGQYVYPFSSERSTEVGSFSMRVRLLGVRDVAPSGVGPALSPSLATDEAGVTVTLDAQRARPVESLAVPYVRTVVSTEHLIDAESDLLESPGMLRVLVATDPEDALPPPVTGDLAIVVDRSASQSKASLAREVAIAKALIADLDPSERYVLLACDSACETFPTRGMATTDALEVDRASRWLEALSPRGASDLASSVEDAAGRIAESVARRLVVLGDGIASSGSIAPHAVAARGARAVSPGTDARFVAIGTDADLVALRALAAATDGVVHHAGSEEDAEAMVASLRAPLVRDLDLTLPEGVRLAAPLPETARLGDELIVFTEGQRARGFDEITLHGQLGEDAFQRSSKTVSVSMSAGVIGRFVARERIAQLEGEADRRGEIIALSKKHFLLSRETSMIVLENDAMFSAFGIERTRRPFGKDAASLAALDVPSSLSTSGDGAGTGHGFGLGSGQSGSAEARLGGGSSSAWGSGGISGELGPRGNLSLERPASRVRLGTSSVSGRLPPEVIQRIVRQNFGRLRACYERELAIKPTLGGRMTVGFTVARDGSVGQAAITSDSTGSTTLGGCVVRTIRALSFPVPEGGIVRVSYPITFSDDGRPMRPTSLRGGFGWVTPVFAAANDDWMKDVPTLARLRAAEARDPERRSGARALVRGLIAAGQFEEALRAAESLLERDGATASTRELVAEARLVAGDANGALIAFEETTEVEPASASTHRRVARALEAGHDEKRACSHWRAASELAPRDGDATIQALRCRARVRNEASAVLDEAAQLENVRGVSQLVADIRAQKPLGYVPAANVDEYAVSVECAGRAASCPSAVHVDSTGRVTSALLPITSARTAPTLQEAGTIRTVLAGGRAEEKVKVTARLAGASRTVDISRAERKTAFFVALE